MMLSGTLGTPSRSLPVCEPLSSGVFAFCVLQPHETSSPLLIVPRCELPAGCCVLRTASRALVAAQRQPQILPRRAAAR